MTIKELIVTKVLSGKWLLTVTAGAALMAITLADCWLGVKGLKPFVDPAALLSIITAVVMAYFGRPADPTQPPGQAPDPADPAALEAFTKKMQERLGTPKP